MATIDSGESARFAGEASVMRMVGASLADAGLIDGDDYTYERHAIPNKRGGVTVVAAEPLTPYPQRNDARVAALERRVAHIENMLRVIGFEPMEQTP